jgi:hypothetical protein
MKRRGGGRREQEEGRMEEAACIKELETGQSL